MPYRPNGIISQKKTKITKIFSSFPLLPSVKKKLLCHSPLTGNRRNLDQVRDLTTCRRGGCTGLDYVLHQAAMDCGVKSFVYAASSSTYGDHPDLPKVEDNIGRPLSPYAVTKYVNELYADVFARTYGLDCICLRYFNVFGKRQDPNGAYAAVIPKWFGAMLKGETVFINGDGETSRDFCYIDNCVQANILAATTENPDAVNQVYNVAFGERTPLNELFRMIKDLVSEINPGVAQRQPVYRDFRPGDVKHSLADTGKIRNLLSYAPAFPVVEGLKHAAKWYICI